MVSQQQMTGLHSAAPRHRVIALALSAVLTLPGWIPSSAWALAPSTTWAQYPQTDNQLEPGARSASPQESNTTLSDTGTRRSSTKEPGVDPEKMRDIVAEQFPALQADLEDLVRIPSISVGQVDEKALQEAAEKVADLLRDAGMPEVEILQADQPDGTPGTPAVVARKPAPDGAPTILLYAHRDVMPVAEQNWDTDPFEPVQKGDRLYGRGAADDKAGIATHIGALRALGKDGDWPNIGITVFVEGEEESGSASFGNFIEKYRDKLAADVVVVADSENWKAGVPALTTSLRGQVAGYLTVSVLSEPVHSGTFGGPVLDANILLGRLLATLHDEEGNVAVAGLVTQPDPEVDYSESDFRTDAGMLPGTDFVGTGSIAGRLWDKPAIAVVGIDSLPADEAPNAIVPSVRAKISMRIAPGQDPAAANAALAEHLQKNAPFGAKVTWEPVTQMTPFQAPVDSAAMQAARASFADAWGVAPVDVGQGGSIGFIADIQDVYPDAAVLLTGVEDPETHAHGPNESVYLPDLQNAVLAETLLIQRLAMPQDSK